MHETSQGIFRKLKVVDEDNYGLSMSSGMQAIDRQSPHSFIKNVLTREQLNELLDMNEVKKIIKARKRSPNPAGHKKAIQK